MRTLYLPYETSFDPGSRTHCCEGLDTEGRPFGAGSGTTLAQARTRLREAILDALLADANQGNDYTPSLHPSPGDGPFLPFSSLDLLPVHIRLARATRQMKQSEVAQRMGISQQAYSKLEQPGCNPTVSLLTRLETALQREILLLA